MMNCNMTHLDWWLNEYGILSASYSTQGQAEVTDKDVTC